MDSQPEVKGFEIKETIEQTPLRDEATKSFFDKWCEINDPILPQIASHQYWEQHVEEQGIMRKNPDGTSSLFIPEDIHLWEILGVIEAIDRDTFAKKPEVWRKKKEKIQDLGKMFRNSGIYLAQRVNFLQHGRPIAEGLAQEFFAYGNALSTGQMDIEQKEITIERIALNPISLEETEQVDKWLSGDKLYSSRMARVEKEIDQAPSTEADQIVENIRQSTLNQFFRIAEKAFILSVETNTNPLMDSLKPWSTSAPIHSAFLRNIESRMKKAIETPKLELLTPIFRRGLEKLLNEIESPNPSFEITILKTRIRVLLRFLKSFGEKLVDNLRVEDMKKDLKVTRETKDAKQISEKEIQITKKIQKAVSKFPYRDIANNPSEMIKDKYMNCLGRTFLAGALLKEIGINYLECNVPDHAVIFLVTNDNRVFWEDMQNTQFSGELDNGDIQGKSHQGKDLTINDIADLSKDPNAEGQTFELTPRGCKRRMPWVKGDRRKFVNIFTPEKGQIAMLLNNTAGYMKDKGYSLKIIEKFLKWQYEYEFGPKTPGLNTYLALVQYDLGYFEEAIGSLPKAIAENPNESSLYDRLGNAFRRLERYHEAIKTYEQAISINPKDEDAYNGLGNTLYIMDRDQEAFEMYQKAISINPESAHPYNGSANILMEKGDYKGAIEAYEKFILLADKKDDSSLIQKAQDKIKECQSKLQEKQKTL